jgi:hypothetical protein
MYSRTKINRAGRNRIQGLDLATACFIKEIADLIREG